MSEQEIENEIQQKGKTAARITPLHIDDQIIATAYLWPGLDDVVTSVGSASAPVDKALRCLTLCVLVLKNGFTVVGKSACASPENFDPEIGRKVAREDARQQIWALEGYYLRHQLAGTQYEAAKSSPGLTVS